MLDGVLWVTGGTDGGASLSSCECYAPGKGYWEPAPSMTARRCVATRR